MPEYLRAYRAAETTATDDGPIRFVASTENVARDGMIINADAWRLDNYRANPVVLWAHDYGGFSTPRPPIGRAEVTTDERALIADITFDRADPFAADLERKVRAGFLNAVSVGWNTLEFAPSPGPEQPPRVTKADLLDISLVPIPSDPTALKERQQRGLATMAHDILAMVEPDDPEVDTADPADLSTTYISIVRHQPTPTEPRSAPPTTEPTPDATARALTWDETAAAMVRLFRPHAQRPDAEREAEYRRLCRAYARHRKTPPEWIAQDDLDALGAEEVRGLFLEGEPDLVPDLFAALASRAGAVLSARNRGDLEQAISLIQGVLRRAQKDADQPEPTDDERALVALQALAESLATEG